MSVTINKAPEDDWEQMVAENLKSGNGVNLEGFVYPDDLEKCHSLAKQFKAKTFLNADRTICYFKISN